MLSYVFTVALIVAVTVTLILIMTHIDSHFNTHCDTHAADCLCVLVRKVRLLEVLLHAFLTCVVD